MHRFLTDERFQECRLKQLAMTPQTLAALRGFGVTPETTLKLEYFFYSNALEKGRALVTALEALGYSAKCDKAAHDPALVVVTGWTSPIAIDEAPLQAWTEAMCDLGFKHDCEFDGWGTPVPAHLAAAAKPAAPAVATADRTVASGGPIERYEKLPAANVFKALDKYRLEFGSSKLFPFIIGNDDDKARFEEMIDPPKDGGTAFIEQAKAVDVPAWFATHKLPADGRWPKEAKPYGVTQTLYDSLTGKMKDEVYLGFVRIENSWEAFAALGFGGWNECPDPHINVAVFQYWRTHYASSPIVISSDVVECHVGKSPQEKDAALVLAREHYAFCPDIVDQGTEKIAVHAASLVKATRWYFWWD